MDNKNPGKDISSQDLKEKLNLTTGNLELKRVVKVSNTLIGNGNFVIMAGPNLVENETMIHECAINLKKSGANIIRGGAFKPLTFPQRSEKYRETGLEGLRWLREAASSVNLPCVSEITSIKDIEKAVDLVDMIQIGTRNMQNFELLRICASMGKPILLKRGFGSSLRDFLAAGEYILNEGNEALVFCERGVVAPHTHRETSRFLIDLQIIPAFKELSGYPIIVDPSHATFWAPWVTPLALASTAVGSDGIMLEVHPDPRNAAVDPLQSLNFEEFSLCAMKVKEIKKVLDSF